MTAARKKYISWADIQEAIKGWDRQKRYYGVPRGGSYIAALLNPCDTPEEADIIVDDLIDSGLTMERYRSKYPDKPFMAPYVKSDHNQWLVFPWEAQEGDTGVLRHASRVMQWLGLEIPQKGLKSEIKQFLDHCKQYNTGSVSAAYSAFMDKLGVDWSDENNKDTPKRVSRYYDEFLSPPEIKYTTFPSDGMDEMVVMTDIPFYSLCAHHHLPFFGLGHIAYIPNGRIVGLSKLARTLEYYSRNFQNQERITHQVVQRLQKELHTKDVACILKARHMCMEMRGVKKHDTYTTTSKLEGAFMENEVRAEFLSMIKH